eukprot:gene4488-4391_t
MPIKCAGAPQKAMYLSCSNWEEKGVLNNIDVEMYNAGGVVFGVPTFVPPLMKYIKRYNAKLNFMHNLLKVDGPSKTATFEVTAADGSKTVVERKFDMIHVVPPQVAPDFVANSPLANSAGWYDGYGACPLTVEKGKVVLAEFSYGGKLAPTFPLNPAVPRRLNWMLKKHVFPALYWFGALKGHDTWFGCSSWLPQYNREWLASDLVAAVVVTIMLIPQSLAYALLAGLPAQVGLYASMAP